MPCSMLHLRHAVGAVVGVAVLISPSLAHSQTTSLDQASLIGLEHASLSDAELSRLRGGYDLGPGVTAYFAFSRIATANGQLIQSILVPQTEITAANPSANFTITGNSTTKVFAAGTPIPMSSQTDGSQQAVINTTPLSANLSVVTGSHSSTLVQSDFGSGITGSIVNVLDNSKLSVVTNLSIETHGLPTFIQAQRTANSIMTGLQRGAAGL